MGLSNAPDWAFSKRYLSKDSLLRGILPMKRKAKGSEKSEEQQECVKKKVCK
jgi:hypothetical protein